MLGPENSKLVSRVHHHVGRGDVLLEPQHHLEHPRLGVREQQVGEHSTVGGHNHSGGREQAHLQRCVRTAATDGVCLVSTRRRSHSAMRSFGPGGLVLLPPEARAGDAMLAMLFHLLREGHAA